MLLDQAQARTVQQRLAYRPLPLADAAASAAVFLYVMTLFRYFQRDALARDLGLQGPLEVMLIGLSFTLSLVASIARRLIVPPLSVTLITVYVAFAALSSVNSFYPLLSAGKATMLILTIGIAIGLSSVIGPRAVITRFYWSMLILLGLGILASLILPDIFPLFRIHENSRYRLWIFRSHPGIVTDYAAVTLIFGLIAQPRPPVVLQYGLLLLCFASGGRVGFSSLVILLALGYVCNNLHLKGLVKGTWLSIVAAIILGTVIQQVEPLRETVLSTIHRTSAEFNTMNGRFALWETALYLILQNPILGLGVEGARNIFVLYGDWASNSHNTYLEIFLSAGWIGGVCFFLGWLLTISYVRNLSSRDAIAVTLIHGYLIMTGIVGGLTLPISTLGVFIIVILAYFAKGKGKHSYADKR